MSEPAFDQLRTKEQLGYIVFTGLKRLNQQYLSLHIIVQSSHKDTAYLDERVESFLALYRELLSALTEEAFGEYVTAVIEKLVEKPKNIDEVSSLCYRLCCVRSCCMLCFLKVTIVWQGSLQPDVRVVVCV
jgi:insulysin